MSGLFRRLQRSSPSAKIAVSWISWATICLTSYYFARRWAGQQKPENLKIRHQLNEEIELKLAKARNNLEHQSEK